VKVGRHLSVGNHLNGKVDSPLVFRGGPNGIAALGLVPVGGGKPDVVVLAGEKRLPVGQAESESLGTVGSTVIFWTVANCQAMALGRELSEEFVISTGFVA
jgi:hypothetical protein